MDFYLQTEYLHKQPPMVFCKKKVVVDRNFAKFIEKHTKRFRITAFVLSFFVL